MASAGEQASDQRVVLPVLEAHLEDLIGAWEMRQGALADPEMDAADLAAINERIEGHLDGLLLGGTASLTLLVETGLGGDANSAAAAAHVLLRSREREWAQHVLSAVEAADDEKRAALADAIALGPIRHIEPELRRLFETAPAAAALAAADALARRGGVSPDSPRINELLKHDDPLVRRSAWRIVAMVDERDTVK